MKYIVYLTTNLINSHIYVGVHGTENPDIFDGYLGNSINRFKYNSELKNPKLPFYKAIKKYGYDAFRRQTLQVFDTEEEALDLEGLIVNEDFIKRTDTYNITLGGGMPPLHNKIIYQYDLKGNFIKEWKSITEAANDLKLDATCIGRSANYKRTAGNFLWSFIKVDVLNISEYNIYNPKIPIYLYDSDKKYIKCYESMSNCAKDLNVSLSRVQRASKLGNKINDYYLSLTLSSIFIKPIFNNIIGVIHQYDLDGNYIKSYLTEKDFKLQTGYIISEVNRSIKMNTTYKNFIWIRGEKLDNVPSQKHKIKKIRKIAQYTQSGELVKIFDTLRSCRKEFPNVSKVLNGISKHCHGYLFKYYE